ncbi:hypothetical protein [Spirosoma sp. 48-14]|uniref:hypothetical protein n=1 Tax=Spirosoma sp. 48-14 TaxID=1895854 RepID=UPI00095B1477|nr:hypothetical protein [Spirosoma sp. 48-14]OJW70629.1 MAG: hypothetical protein BGO59_25040 [Spirosoma sp. 48-14]
MHKIILGASVVAMLSLTQSTFGQAVQEAKAEKKDQKADKKVAKAQELKSNAATGKGVEIAGISDSKTRNAKADRKLKHAEKKELKSDAKELKAVAKDKKKKGDGVD